MINNQRLINDVTLVCIDCVDVSRAIRAIEKCLREVPFKNVKFLTSKMSGYKYEVKIPNIPNTHEYSRFCLNELYKYIDTEFCLVVQHDGWIVDGSKWDDIWFQYDYVGGNSGWTEGGDNGKGGNGGFSFRSRRLLEACSKLDVVSNEDVVISGLRLAGHCRRGVLEGMGMRFATRKVQSGFSLDNMSYSGQFGHHRSKPNDDIHYDGSVIEVDGSKVISALYGSGKNYISAMNFMKEIVGGKTACVNNRSIGCDPIFGVKKELKITIAEGQKTREVTFTEGMSINYYLLKENRILVIYRYHEKVSTERKIGYFKKLHKIYLDYIAKTGVKGKFYLVCDNVTDEVFNKITEGVGDSVDAIRIESKKELIVFAHRGHYSFYITAMNIVKKECSKELFNDSVFFCEDDYDYTDDCIEKTMSFMRSHPSDFVSMFDPPDRYFVGNVQEDNLYRSVFYRTEIIYDKGTSHHWRTSISTCHSFSGNWLSIKNLLNNTDVFSGKKPRDHIMFQEIWKTKKHKLWIPIPGLATHCDGPHFKLTKVSDA
jgi:hypothetical protein